MKQHGGKRPGAGRKPKAVEEWQAVTLNRLLEQGWPIEKRVAVIRKLVSQALKGDTKAASLLLAYGYGKPTETVKIGGHKESGPVAIEVVEIRGPGE